MEIKGTREAFRRLISQRGIHNKLGVGAKVVGGWRIYLKNGEKLSLDKMEEMLIKAGATVKQEKVWEVDVKE